jgi:hypothetical protein
LNYSAIDSPHKGGFGGGSVFAKSCYRRSQALARLPACSFESSNQAHHGLPAGAQKTLPDLGFPAQADFADET